MSFVEFYFHLVEKKNDELCAEILGEKKKTTVIYLGIPIVSTSKLDNLNNA